MIFDDGYQYGLGAFETVAIYKGKAVFLEEHIKRLNETLDFLGLRNILQVNDVEKHINKYGMISGALKIIVSEKNVYYKIKRNPYNEERYIIGFKMLYSSIKRNESSPFVFYKTLNYGECILEKRDALKNHIDEKIFLNTKGFITEGTSCNIFFVSGKKIYTPAMDCGLLPGIVREYIYKKYVTIEDEIKPEHIEKFDECFITNSLMGVMPVNKLDTVKFEIKENSFTYQIRKEYTKFLGEI